MKSFKLVLLLSLFSYSLAGLSKTIIVTDIDDTIKKANSMGGIGGVYHFLKKKPYEYTRDIFNEIKKVENDAGEETAFYYVSAAPSFTFDAPAWLATHKFPIGPTYLKTKENGGETYAYKYRTIKAIIEAELKADPNLKILFFGDNSQHDATVYYDLRNDLSLQDAQIYIRDVSTEATYFDAKVPVVRLPGVNYFFSEMEFVNHTEFPYMTEEIIQDIQKGYKLKTIIPLYTLDTLANRLRAICESSLVVWSEIQAAKCKVEGRMDANKYWLEYHSLYKD